MTRVSTRSEHDFLMDEEEGYRRFLDERDRREKRRQAIADKEDMFGPDGLTMEEREILAQDEGRTCGDCKYSAGRWSLYCYETHRPREVETKDPACECFKRR